MTLRKQTRACKCIFRSAYWRRTSARRFIDSSPPGAEKLGPRGWRSEIGVARLAHWKKDRYWRSRYLWGGLAKRRSVCGCLDIVLNASNAGRDNLMDIARVPSLRFRRLSDSDCVKCGQILWLLYLQDETLHNGDGRCKGWSQKQQ